MTNPDILIIGAGHNALVTAAYLAKAGKQVLVLERRDVVGGQLAGDQSSAPASKARHCIRLALCAPRSCATWTWHDTA